jgi:phenylpropionate dioxygenase-like ring-hydroxylating dioxygenase large terminal subunit
LEISSSLELNPGELLVTLVEPAQSTDPGVPVIVRPPKPTTTIEVERYRSSDFHAQEMAGLWSKTWQLACLDTDLPEVGSWITYDIGHWSVLVVRTADGLKAFHNVCPHRGRRIRDEECGTSAKVRCAYHGWSWTLDGVVAEIPELDQFSWSTDELGLLPVRVDQWGRWICINLDNDAPSLEEFMAPIAPLLEPYSFPTQHRWKAHSTILKSNWKNIMDAFNEAYHARSIHNESHTFINYVDYEVGLVGEHSFMVIPFGIPDAYVNKVAPDFEDQLDAMSWSFGAFGEDVSMVDIMRTMEIPEGGTLQDLMRLLIGAGMAANNIDISKLSESQITDDWHVMVFPNIIINSFSFGHWLFRIRPNGDDPTSSIFDIWYFHQTPTGMTVPDVPVQHMPHGDPELGAVVLQDVNNIELQQKGHMSPACPDFKVSRLESRIVHFHQTLDTYLGIS